MENLSVFLRNFLKNKGHFVFGSLLIAKICGFISSVAIIRLLSENDFGLISIVTSFFAVFLAFSGFGSQQILLRYGSIAQTEEEKTMLSSYLLRQGFLYQIILSVLFVILSVFYLDTFQKIIWLFIAFSIRLIGYFFYNHIQSQLRINGKNREFSRLNNIVNISGLIFIIIFIYFWGILGYIIAMTIMPFISLFWFKGMNFSKRCIITFSKKEIWTYGLFTAGTAVLSDMLFSLDIILIGFLLNESAVAGYKTAILLPSNLTFIALTFMQSDFPELAKHHKDKFFLKNYISNYYKIFIPLCLTIFVAFYILKDYIIVLFFGEKYRGIESAFIILTSAFLLNMLMRNLYGNLLSAVGKMAYNTIVSILALIVLVSLSILLVPKYGVAGMAIAQSITLLTTGFLLMTGFFSYIRKLS
ncbi:oligosaccharide flippase family protein [Epilithonimonas arachidiradicis]|uniref:O-antigen/teichoic acid export membrane protein n=2 Tax=Epilithonimonas arachidiradicis TaxID=1617282 RepID=A0A420DCD5_9FLAO|nr:oligosaccharide flippase family protein [Epilithonimonas arachidiradicis]RKE89511.1 O-antigen/teichoic acid export membrane protein [Epilithonimonas arachidiradicis]